MSTSSFQIMLQKPATAPTGNPSDLRVSGGSAWNARKMKPDPSTKYSRIAGPSWVEGRSVSGSGGASASSVSVIRAR